MLPPELPPISNKPLYAYRVLAKWFSFFFFGFTTLILALVIFPIMRLFIHPGERFKKHMRSFVSSSLAFFISVMHFIKALDLNPGDREAYRHLSSKIIVANHPSLLDPVVLISLIPNADTIVSPKHNNVILSGVIRQLYMLGSLDYEDILGSCIESLNRGNCLIIFPEGTRTPRSGRNSIKKGAARIAMASGCNIIPLHIGGTDKYGLGRKDPWTGFNPNERYVYDISMGPEISPEKYRDLSMPRAVRALTREFSAFLFPAIEG